MSNGLFLSQIVQMAQNYTDKKVDRCLGKFNQERKGYRNLFFSSVISVNNPFNFIWTNIKITTTTKSVSNAPIAGFNADKKKDEYEQVYG